MKENINIIFIEILLKLFINKNLIFNYNYYILSISYIVCYYSLIYQVLKSSKYKIHKQ